MKAPVGGGETSLFNRHHAQIEPADMKDHCSIQAVDSSDLLLCLCQWVPEISHHCPRTPFLLVGTQVDLREDGSTIEKLAKNKQRPLYPESGEKLARELRAVKYVECSALTQVGGGGAEFFHALKHLRLYPDLSVSLSLFSISEVLKMCSTRPFWLLWSPLRPKPRESAFCYRLTPPSESWWFRNGRGD